MNSSTVDWNGATAIFAEAGLNYSPRHVRRIVGANPNICKVTQYSYHGIALRRADVRRLAALVAKQKKGGKR